MLPTAQSGILGVVEVVNQADLPSRTYRIDFETGRVSGFVDGAQAVSQAIRKTLLTERFSYLIYSWNYGMEWNGLTGKSPRAVESELRRLLSESLLQDERILSVGEVAIDRISRGVATVTVTVETAFGEVKEEVTAYV
ncbi:Phage protein [uncultured Eubacteriales bacterium]|uniref:Phage protein n=1 Tax=uncultured Eubacteriales bacterium TaxID=172733 RepID=A0A212J5I6_9FIRM|nr:Phage protein [uncultured Eubacteriales bacterium]